MKLFQKIFKRFKYLIFVTNYKLFTPKKNEGYNSLNLNKSIIEKTIIFNKIKSINKYHINFKLKILINPIYLKD